MEKKMKRLLEGRWGRMILAAILTVSVLSGGCAGRQKIEPTSQVEITQRLDAPATSTSYGHPFRLVAFVLHPVGVLIDFVIVQPIYFIASLAPTLFGYTAEDEAALQKQREVY
jgi:hypothetical protein